MNKPEQIAETFKACDPFEVNIFTVHGSHAQEHSDMTLKRIVKRLEKFLQFKH